MAQTSDDSSDVLHLTAPMTLPPGTSIEVTCSSPVKLYSIPAPIYISAIYPTTIFSSDGLRIEPSATLGKTFVKGWNSLPDELKEMVLENDIVEEEPISAKHINPPNPHWRHLPLYSGLGVVTADDLFNPNWLDHPYYRRLRMTPEIASISRRIFWKKNAFLLPREMRHAACGIRFTPPQQAEQLIQRLGMELDVTSHDWSNLLFSNTVMATMPDLKAFHVWFVPLLAALNNKSALYHFVKYAHRHPLTLSCAGQVHYVDTPAYDSFTAREKKLLQQAVEKNLIFAKK